jgi:hypothetical protein
VRDALDPGSGEWVRLKRVGNSYKGKLLSMDLPTGGMKGELLKDSLYRNF